MSPVLSTIIGLVLLIAATLKIYYAQPFIAHVRRYGILPDKPGALLAVLVIEMEAGLGAALVIYLYPSELLPFTAVLILLSSVLTTWGIKTGRIRDCGCYGSLLNLKLQHTLILNGSYVTVLIAAWLDMPPGYSNDFWKIWVVVGVILTSHFILKRTVKKPLFSLYRFYQGQIWNHRWFNTTPMDEEQLFVFLDDGCQECKEWILKLNKIWPQIRELKLLGIIPVQREKTDRIAVDFPVHRMRWTQFFFMAGQIPLAVLVKQQVVKAVWHKTFPEDVFFEINHK